MKLRRNKKGFTIVELIIVIAVIGVLTAILVPTFISLTAKANKASDQSLVKNLNIALASREGEADDKPNKTMHDAVEDLELWGYKLSALATKSDEKLVYNLEDNRFYLDGDKKLDEVENKMNLWRIQNDLGDQEYSIYAGDAFALTEVTGLHVGFDVGYHTTIQSIEYSNTNAASSVVIRTDSFASEVSVNTSGSVTHYGNVGKLDIQKVAMSSFHENGRARAVQLAEGNFVIEPEGSVTLVSVVATEADKVTLNIQGDLEVLAGDDAYYSVTSGSADETVDAAIGEDTIAIVNGVAKSALSAADFADGNKVVLLQDYSTQVTLGSCTVIGNLTKLRASITGNKTIVLKNIHSTLLSVSNFTGNLTLDGGLLEYDKALAPNDQNAAFYVSTGYGSYTFKNMTIAASTNKGIKISHAASVTIEGCEFDATDLDASIDHPGAFTGRSLAAIDIQEQNLKVAADAGNGAMAITIKNNKFVRVIQGSIEGGVKDSDTAGAIKIKTEKAARSAGFSKVIITGNTFIDNYRDVVVGCNVFGPDVTGTKEQADMDAAGNVVASPLWEVSGNTTTLTESVIANRGTLTFHNTANAANSISEKVGRLEGGCGLWETARSARSWLNS